MTCIQCDCGKFQAKLNHFPENTPGRIACYCNDCKNYLEKLERKELLDAYGGTEIVPVYPNEFEILQGEDLLICNRLSPNGLNRWSTSCCNSPIGNNMPKFPWIGLIHSVFKANDPQTLERLGPIRSRVMGKDIPSSAPFKVSKKMSLNDALVVLPFIIKGFLLSKQKSTHFFKEDGTTPIKEPKILI